MDLPGSNGHLQAVETDVAGRKQYIYHEIWRARRDQAKFDHMMDFATALPAMRPSRSSTFSFPVNR